MYLLMPEITSNPLRLYLLSQLGSWRGKPIAWLLGQCSHIAFLLDSLCTGSTQTPSFDSSVTRFLSIAPNSCSEDHLITLTRHQKQCSDEWGLYIPTLATVYLLNWRGSLLFFLAMRFRYTPKKKTDLVIQHVSPLMKRLIASACSTSRYLMIKKTVTDVLFLVRAVFATCALIIIIPLGSVATASSSPHPLAPSVNNMCKRLFLHLLVQGARKCASYCHLKCETSVHIRSR